MLVARKIGPASNGPDGPGVLIPVNNSLQTAISFYFANRETPVPRFYRCKDGKGKKVMNYGYSIRRVANMHEIAYSLLQRELLQVEKPRPSRKLTKRHDPDNHGRGSTGGMVPAYASVGLSNTA